MLTLYFHGKKPTSKGTLSVIQNLLENPERAREFTKDVGKTLLLQDGGAENTHIAFVATALDNDVVPVVGGKNPVKEYLFVVRVRTF